MKKALFLPMLLFSIVSFSQKNPKSVQAEIEKQFEKIEYWVDNSVVNDTINTYDSVLIANDYILSLILKQGKNNPASFTYPFTSTDIASSKDKSLRVYSWDTYTGGTMHIFYAVAQFRGNDNKVHTRLLCDTSEGDPGLWYSEIYSFTNKGKKYYFCIGNGIYSTGSLGQEVQVYTVNGKLLEEASIIKTQKGLTNSIHVSFDISNLSATTEPSIVFDETTKELKIPVIDEHGKMLNKNIIYKFNGEHFVKTGTK